jgi:hypothetical protein
VTTNEEKASDEECVQAKNLSEDISLKLKKVEEKGENDMKKIKDFTVILNEAKTFVDNIK